ncbi:MAG: hypothetical protein QW728_05060, partial [Thermoplasmata archaeon]
MVILGRAEDNGELNMDTSQMKETAKDLRTRLDSVEMKKVIDKLEKIVLRFLLIFYLLIAGIMALLSVIVIVAVLLLNKYSDSVHIDLWIVLVVAALLELIWFIIYLFERFDVREELEKKLYLDNLAGVLVAKLFGKVLTAGLALIGISVVGGVVTGYFYYIEKKTAAAITCGLSVFVLFVGIVLAIAGK